MISLELLVSICEIDKRWFFQGTDDDWYVKLSYGPRWVTYFVGSGYFDLHLCPFMTAKRERPTSYSPLSCMQV